MATPAFLRYLPARLKPLSSPAVWAPLTVFALLSIFLWEYHKNPEWFNREQISNTNPESELTPEEQARLSEIDTIDLLLESARIPGADRRAASGNTDISNLEIPEAGGEASARPLATQSNPFAAYEEEYRFPGSGNASAGTAGRISPNGAAPNISPSLSGTAPVPTPSTDSALAEAIRQQNAVAGSEQNGLSATSGGSAAPASSATIPSDGSSPSTLELPPAQAPGNGITVPFTPTTLDMSPPAGTTGYQTPASSQLPIFNTPSQQPTRNPFSSNGSQSAFPQSGSPQSNGFPTAAPIGAPLPGAAAPNTNGYTPPRFAQPEQNRRVR